MNSAFFPGRGRGSGGLLMLLGAWGALVPFVGPYINFAYTPDKTWAYTSGRLWLSVLPGAAAFLGGLIVVASAGMARAGAFLAALGGAWFVVGRSVTAVVVATTRPVTAGTPVTGHGALFGPSVMRLLEGLGFFYGLGVVIVFLAALVLGRGAVARAAARGYAPDSTAVLADDSGYRPAY